VTDRTLTYQFIRPPDRRYTFSSDLLDATSDHIALANDLQPSKPLAIDGREVLAGGYHAVWFLFNGRPYDVARVYRPDGTFTGYYADVLEPVHWYDADPETLAPLVDLFLDLWVTPAGDHLVLDEDEFDEAISRNILTPEQAAHARTTLDSLVTAAVAGNFPPPLVRKYPPDGSKGELRTGR